MPKWHLTSRRTRERNLPWVFFSFRMPSAPDIEFCNSALCRIMLRHRILPLAGYCTRIKSVCPIKVRAGVQSLAQSSSCVKLALDSRHESCSAISQPNFRLLFRVRLEAVEKSNQRIESACISIVCRGPECELNGKGLSE